MATLGQLMGKKSQKGATEVYGKSKSPDPRSHGPVKRIGPEYTPGSEDGPSQDLNKDQIKVLQGYQEAHFFAASSLFSSNLTFTEISTQEATNKLNNPEPAYQIISDMVPQLELGTSGDGSRASKLGDARAAGLTLSFISSTKVDEVREGGVLTEVEQADEITKKTRQFLSSINRFHDDDATTDDRSTYITSDGKFSAKGTFYHQHGNFGRYVEVHPSESENTTRYTTAGAVPGFGMSFAVYKQPIKIVGGDGAETMMPDGGKLYTVYDLRTRVLQSLVMGTGQIHKDVSPVDTAFTHPNSESAALADINAFIPGQAQMGFGKIPIDKMYIPDADYYGLSKKDGFSDAEYDVGEVDEDNYSVSFSTTSYGHLNSPLEPYGGALPFGMILPAIYGVIAVILFSLLIEGFVALMKIISGPKSAPDVDETIDPHNPWLMKKGSSKNPTSGGGFGAWMLDQLLTAMGWPTYLDYEFTRNFQRGIKIFYGMKPEDDGVIPESDPSELLDLMGALLESPQFYTIMIKRVVADTEQIGEAFSNFNPSPLGGISSIFEILQVIGSSVTFRFLVRMAEVGEQAAKFMYEAGKNSGPGAMDTEDFELSAHNRLGLTRFKVGTTRKSPTSVSAFRSAFLAGQALGDVGTISPVSGDGFIEANNLHQTVSYQTDRTTLSPLLVAYTEEQIQADYMPFTIQDTRTNEIIGLPAFIESVDDSFAVDYNTTEGYGRTDAVKIYNKTTRQINVNFKLVAHSEKDHDYMWHVINKITAMAYPQRSAGRILTGKNIEYTEPFSSVPIGTPVVRLRLGELLHTNYSETAFARLLGSPGLGSTLKGGEDAYSQAKEKIFNRKKLSNELIVAKKKFMHKMFDPNSADATKADEALATIKKLGEEMVIPRGSKLKIVPGVPDEEPGGLSAMADAAASAMGLTSVPPEFAPVSFTSPVNLKCKVVRVVDVTVRKGEYMAPIQDQKKVQKDDEKKGISTTRYAIFKIGKLEKEKVKETRRDLTKEFGGLIAYTIANMAENAEHGVAIMMELSENNMPEPRITPDQIKEHLSAEMQKIYAEANKDNILEEKGVKHRQASDFGRFAAGHPTSMAFKTTMGRGLAGVITGLSLDYGSGTWRVDPGHRAPNIVGINLAFSPIHDLTPGLDNFGRMSAPTHPVGSLNSDPHESRTSLVDPHQPISEIEKAYLKQPSAKKAEKKGGLLGALGL